jgi:hypothetical protein
MPERITRGKALIGTASVTALEIGGAAVTSTAAEINQVADLSARGALVKCATASISSAPTGSEQDAGIDLPAKAVVLDVFLDVTAAEVTGGTKTMSVGLLSSESGGDADGFLVGVSCAATGLKRGVATVTAGGSETYFSATTRGALLGSFVAGADSAGDVGTVYERPHLSDSVTAKSVSYTAGDSDWVEFRGTLVVVYVEVA